MGVTFNRDSARASAAQQEVSENDENVLEATTAALETMSEADLETLHAAIGAKLQAK